MDYADDITRAVIGATEVVDLVATFSDWGRRLASKPRIFRPEERADWEHEQELLKEVESWWMAPVSETCVASLTQLPTLERPLLALESQQVLDEVALFELKRFFYHARNLVAAAAAEISTIDAGWADWLGEQMQIIHPERHPSPRFILAAQLDERLAEARAEVKRARRAERAERRELESRISGELGGKFDVQGRFIPSSPGKLADPRLRPLGDGRYEIVNEALDTRSAAVAAAQDHCWDIEIEVRTSLSDQLRGEVAHLEQVRDALGALDVRCALVELRRRWQGCWPEWGEQSVIEHGRHPRLLETLEPDELQPISIALDERSAIVTGPNMGGKSVLLELIGLCQWCAQSGYPVPAARCEFTPVAHIVYVGSEAADHPQSGLSSFGREVRRVVDQSGADGPTLWLLDEFARGTHPEEGAAIARDFVAARHAAGDRLVAATHFPELARMPGAAHFQIAGLSAPGALDALSPDLELSAIEAALRAAMDYTPLPRGISDVAVPRDARRVARALGLSLQDDE